MAAMCIVFYSSYVSIHGYMINTKSIYVRQLRKTLTKRVMNCVCSKNELTIA